VACTWPNKQYSTTQVCTTGVHAKTTDRWVTTSGSDYQPSADGIIRTGVTGIYITLDAAKIYTSTRIHFRFLLRGGAVNLGAQSLQYHLPSGASARPTHSRWNWAPVSVRVCNLSRHNSPIGADSPRCRMQPSLQSSSAGRNSRSRCRLRRWPRQHPRRPPRLPPRHQAVQQQRDVLARPPATSEMLDSSGH
jgi:hypothetical protein